MAYRDDVEAMFQRASALERELAAMRDKLDERDRELAKLRGHAPRREDTSPGVRAMRGGPSIDDLMERLLFQSPFDDAKPPPSAPATARTRSMKIPPQPTEVSSYLAVPMTPKPPPTPHERLAAKLVHLDPRQLDHIDAVVEGLLADAPRVELARAVELAAMLARGR